MKSFLHKAALTGLILLYAFLVSFHTGDTFSYNGLSKKQNGQASGTYHSSVNKSLFPHTNTTENSVSVIKVGSRPGFKHRFSASALSIRYSCMLVRSRLFQHLYFYDDVCIKLHHSRILFPFHYFW